MGSHASQARIRQVRFRAWIFVGQSLRATYIGPGSEDGFGKLVIQIPVVQGFLALRDSRSCGW